MTVRQASGSFDTPFRTTFSLPTDAILSTVLITFNFGHDETGSIFLNETNLATFDGFVGNQPITLDAGSNATFFSSVQTGTNTFRFQISNSRVSRRK